jgi:hypothetical protein
MSYSRGNPEGGWPALGYSPDVPPPLTPHQQQQQQQGLYTVQTTQRVEYYPKSVPDIKAQQMQFTEVHHYTTVSTASYPGVYPPSGPPPPVNFSVPPPAVDKVNFSQPPPPFNAAAAPVSLPMLNVPPPGFGLPSSSSSGMSPPRRNADLQLDRYKVSAKRADKIAELLLKNDTVSSSRSPPRRSRRSRSRYNCVNFPARLHFINKSQKFVKIILIFYDLLTTDLDHQKEGGAEVQGLR